MSGRLSQVAGIVADWRLWAIVAVCAAGIGVVVLWSRRQVHLAKLPSSMFRRHKADPEASKQTLGPIGGEVTRLQDTPPSTPTGASVSVGRRPSPPLARHSGHSGPTLPPEPDITIDLNALESEPPTGPSPPRHSVVDLRELEDAAPLPADPWA